MIKNNFDICHNFFYSDDSICDKNRFSVSYYYDTFYSYATAIGKKVVGKDGASYLLLSDNNMSNTTAKHISYLRQASPLDVCYIPVRFGQREITINGAIDDILKNLDFYKNSKLSQKPNREAYINYFNMLSVIDEKIQTVKKSIINKYKPLFDDLHDEKAIKLLNKINREKLKVEREKLKKQLAGYLKKYDLSQLAKMVYSYTDYTLNGKPEIKQAIKKYINPHNDLSFVWSDGEDFKTSKSITISKKECDLIIKLYKNKELKHGFRLSYYTVLEVTDKFIKIGCHKIPVENINCLIK